jgi:Transglutaminase-like superfamily
MRTAKYFLSKDCFVCSAQNYWIVLNARRDKYSCISHADLMSIGGRLHGWRSESGAATHFPQFESDALIDSLISTGIITANPGDGKPFVECECPVCERSLEIAEPNASVRQPLSCIVRFFLACARVDWYLRKNDLSRALTRIERRRTRVRSSAATRNVIHARRLIAVFKDLRPLYPRPYLCLFDSLALVELLASYRLFPRVVFGVIADPFQAHCWLQEGNTVLNDDLERVARYKPILSA